MENHIATTIEQSKRLIEFGIDINTADMVYLIDITMPNGEHRLLTKDDFAATDGDNLPAWSLSALLNILTEHDFTIITITAEHDFTIKCVSTKFNVDIPIRHCKVWFTSLLDAAFEMVCYLLKNNFINNN